MVCTVDLPTAYQQLLDDLRPPRAAAARPVLALGGGLARRRARDCRRPRSPTTTSTSAQEWSAAFDALLKRGRADARPVAAGDHPLARRPDAGAADGCSTLYVLEPVPNLNGKINWSTEAGPMRDRLHVFLAAAGISQRHDHRGVGHSAGVAGSGHGGRHTFCAGPHLRPDRAVPPVERRAATARNVLRRVRNRPWGRRSDGADLRQTRRQSSR